MSTTTDRRPLADALSIATGIVAELAVTELSLAMPSPEDRGKQIRQGLRRALQGGRALGGLRPARAQENKRMHLQALQQALDYRDVIEQGREKSLSALSRDLFAAGCATSNGQPLRPEMVRRLRARLEEALLAVARGELIGLPWVEPVDREVSK